MGRGARETRLARGLARDTDFAGKEDLWRRWMREVSAHRIVVGTDNGASIRVTGLERGFLLGPDYAPQPSFLSWTGDVLLDPSTPTAVIWHRN
ncbi:hypothetical protein [Rhizomonospora bruguierae]|uniref:hypothetical protein n=1 Tax=Rhizomonospora bruguierae TaxID=1581705 RepID=UPI0020BFEFEA|nr:hypothetical protein [Micromonospora sp. NBRC 107566]